MEETGLVDYYQTASPVGELGKLRIGSRPDRRFGVGSLDDLRAIPWVFAWTQNRHHVPAWYGLGSAVEKFIKVRGNEGKKLLKRMYKRWPLFSLVIDGRRNPWPCGSRTPYVIGQYGRPALDQEIHQGDISPRNIAGI